MQPRQLWNNLLVAATAARSYRSMVLAISLALAVAAVGNAKGLEGCAQRSRRRVASTDCRWIRGRTSLKKPF